MEVMYFNEFSTNLNRNMEFKVYGTKGIPCIAFPSQNDRFYFYENQGIINSMEEEIEAGKIQVFTLDNYDFESFSATWKNPYDRIRSQEAYYRYVIDEIIPRIREINKSDSKIMTFGCSLGAYQAMNFFLRRPDLFNNVLALSGIYHIGFFIHDYADELTFYNSPIDSLKYMELSHPYVNMYKNSKIIVSVGYGTWEEECIKDTRELERQFDRLNINKDFVYYGMQFVHDWPSWNIIVKELIKKAVN